MTIKLLIISEVLEEISIRLEIKMLMCSLSKVPSISLKFLELFQSCYGLTLATNELTTENLPHFIGMHQGRTDNLMGIMKMFCFHSYH
jgi:hypothetical protein